MGRVSKRRAIADRPANRSGKSPSARHVEFQRVPCWFIRLALLWLSVVLLSLANAPFGQAWLAWVGVVPWLIALTGLKSFPRAFGWGWLGGFLFFAANIWWLWTASIPGMVALMIYLALYWGLAAVLLHGLGLLNAHGFTPRGRPADSASVSAGSNSGSKFSSGGRPILSVLLIAAVWTATEWLRAYMIDPRGFPWMFLGHTQSPLLAMCQIADVVGVFGISFWVVLINAWLFLLFNPANRWRPLLRSGVVVAAVLAVVAGYGLYRLSEDTTVPGPRIMLVQSNHSHGLGGQRTIPRETIVDYHLAATRKALESDPADLVVWSEAVMPPLNEEARRELQGSPGGKHMERTHQRISRLAAETRTAIITGGNYVGKWVRRDGRPEGTDIRNSAYFYGPDGRQSPERYDKTELVAFSERVAFRNSVGWLHRIMLWLAPPVASVPLVAGEPDALTVFTVRVPALPAKASGPASATLPSPATTDSASTDYRFVTPICLENIYPPFISRMVGSASKGDTAPFPQASSSKRADFIVNLSNDGWFSPIERHQHLQQIVFRSIENRTPQARACNTGISAFIDSCGRVLDSVPCGDEGTLVRSLPLDVRSSIYMRFGDAFSYVCLVGVGVAIFLRLVARFTRPS